MSIQTIDKIMYYLLILFAVASNLSTGVTSFVIVIGLVVSTLHYIKNREIPNIDKGILKIIFFFLGVECIVAITSLHPVASFKEVFSTMYRFSPLFFVILFVKEKSKLVNISIAFIFSAIINDFYGAYQFLSHSNIRPVGFNNTATFFASHLLMAIPMLYLLGKECILSNLARKVSWFGMIFSIVMLFASGTRGGWIAFAIMLGTFVILAKKQRKILLIGMAGISLFFIGVNIVVPSFHARTESIISLSNQANTERVLMWKSAWQMTKDYPITGIGQGEFREVYNTKYISPLAKERAKNDKDGHTHPHNNFLKVLSEEGIIGFVGFCSLYGYFFIRFYKRYRLENETSYNLTALLIMIAIHAEGLTDWNIGQVPIMREFWFLLGLMIVADAIESVNKDKLF